MEQENVNQEKDTTISNANIVEDGFDNDGLTEYRIYEHPLLPKRIVKRGVCWPALILGPIYLIYKQLWVQVFFWIVVIGVSRYYAISSYPGYNNPYSDDGNTVEQISGGTMLLYLLILWGVTNELWEKDLEKRGYVMTKSLRARSMDDALAIIEREKSLAKNN